VGGVAHSYKRYTEDVFSGVVNVKSMVLNVGGAGAGFVNTSLTICHGGGGPPPGYSPNEDITPNKITTTQYTRDILSLLSNDAKMRVRTLAEPQLIETRMPISTGNCTHRQPNGR